MIEIICELKVKFPVSVERAGDRLIFCTLSKISERYVGDEDHSGTIS